MIEQAIYDRLKTVTANVFPEVPTVNTPALPWVTYRVTGTEPQLTTQGVSSLTKYTAEVDTYARNKATVSSLQAAARSRLHGYRGGQIQGAFLQTESGEEIDEGFHGVQVFSVWADDVNLQATTDSTGQIQTGNNSVTLSACNHTLTLDCDGLLFDGAEIGTGGVGPKGDPGDSAYDVAVANGFVGSEAAWLLSLAGEDGVDGNDGADSTVPGPAGADGSDGASAYQIAVSNGFVGDEATWLLSLVGNDGADGADGNDGPNNVTSTTTTNLTGYLKGNASTVSATTTIPNTDVTGLGTASTQSTGTFCQVANNLSDVTASTARSNLGLAIGSQVQAYDGDLQAIAALATTGIARRTGTNTWSVGTTVSVAEGGTGATTASTARTNLGLGTIAVENTNTILPPGVVWDFAGSTAPAGWLACDGSAVSRTTYAALFAAISTTWGSGNGSTTFNLPDFRGRATIGSGTGSGLTARTLADVGGSETQTISQANLPSAYPGTVDGRTTDSGTGAYTAFLIARGANQQTMFVTSAGTGTAHNNMQPFAVVQKIIKT